MTAAMRAVVIRGPGRPGLLGIEEVPIPPLGPGQVRVRVSAAALNFRDVHARRAAETNQPDPLVPGSDFAGEIAEVGTGVTGFRPGERVVGATPAGAQAEYVVVVPALLAHVPDGLDDVTAATLPTAGLSASFLLDLAGLTAGDSAVTYAPAGGLGSYLGGLLRAAGVRSIGITSTQAKATAARAAGHEVVVVHSAGDLVSAVQAATDGQGAGIVFDSVGGPGFAARFGMLSDGGTLILCGRAAGEPNLADAQDQLISGRRNLALRDFYLASHLARNLGEFRSRIGSLAAALSAGHLRVPITALPPDQIKDAHALLESGRSVGKLVLLFASPSGTRRSRVRWPPP
ncbi:MAG TPA: zinc-binding dehydrogenase [Streptosporangiaceae bacterium]|nr:zinc-binding dehydrogenase [Streptosporangiaceae bacterium]